MLYPRIARIVAITIATFLATSLLTVDPAAQPADATVASDEARALTLINQKRARLGIPAFATNSSLRALAHEWAVEHFSGTTTGSNNDVALVILPEDGATGEAPPLVMTSDWVYSYPADTTPRAERVARLLTPSKVWDPPITWKTRKYSHAAVGLVQKGRTTYALLAYANYPECFPREMKSSPPSITGTGRVGDVLTASAGSWSSTPASFSYTWKANGATVGRGRTYIPSSAQLGASITVTVEGARRCFTAPTPKSSTAKLVTAGVRPVVTGDHNVGSTLVVEPGPWDETGLAFEFQWLRDGRAIPGATADSYVLDATDRSAVVTARVTGRQDGTSQSKSSAQSAAIGAPLLAPLATPLISGDARYDSVLVADAGDWSPTADAVSYQWRIDGARVLGATGPTFRVPYRAIGKRVTVTVIGTRTGFAASSSVSSPTSAIGLGRFTEDQFFAYHYGEAGVGQVLEGALLYPSDANNPALNRHSVVVSYQWLRDGVPIEGATRPRYRVTSADAGAAIALRAMARHRGFERFVSTSTSVVAG